jgi:peptide/nickel transport system substrate-binding protein
MVHQMQDMLWTDMPYVVLYNSQTLQAYRTDRVTGFQIQPDKIGDLLAFYGPLSVISIHPPVATSTATKSSSSSTIWIVVVVVLLLAAVVWFVLRRRRDEDDQA